MNQAILDLASRKNDLHRNAAEQLKNTVLAKFQPDTWFAGTAILSDVGVAGRFIEAVRVATLQRNKIRPASIGAIKHKIMALKLNTVPTKLMQSRLHLLNARSSLPYRPKLHSRSVAWKLPALKLCDPQASWPR